MNPSQIYLIGSWTDDEKTEFKNHNCLIYDNYYNEMEGVYANIKITETQKSPVNIVNICLSHSILVKLNDYKLSQDDINEIELGLGQMKNLIIWGGKLTYDAVFVDTFDEVLNNIRDTDHRQHIKNWEFSKIKPVELIKKPDMGSADPKQLIHCLIKYYTWWEQMEIKDIALSRFLGSSTYLLGFKVENNKKTRITLFTNTMPILEIQISNIDVKFKAPILLPWNGSLCLDPYNNSNGMFYIQLGSYNKNHIYKNILIDFDYEGELIYKKLNCNMINYNNEIIDIYEYYKDDITKSGIIDNKYRRYLNQYFCNDISKYICRFIRAEPTIDELLKYKII